MTHGHWGCHTGSRGSDHLGRAAERFARRVARDAGRFAERVQEHAGEFAQDFARGFRRDGAAADACRRRAAPDVRRVFEDVRGVLTDIIDGVDEFLAHAFPETADTGGGTEWTRMVSNREATCGRCARTIVAGEEAFVRRAEGRREYRCTACGTSPAGAEPTGGGPGH